jgi:hypothetical protein
MTDKNTQDKEPGKDTPDKDSYEQRYKDLQATMTTTKQDNAVLKEAAAKDKELLDAVTPFIDYDKMNGKVAPPEDGDALVDQQTLTKTVQSLKDEISQNRVTQNFRSKYPDMVAHEDLVGMYLQKTNPREPMDARIAKAVESTKTLLESQQTKGREQFEKEAKDKTTKEAEASGFGGSTTQKGEKKEPDGETYDEYVQGRKDASAKAQGLI